MTAQRLALFLVRRLGALVVMVTILSFVIFSLLYVAPGSPVDILLGSQPRTPETVQLLNERYHLDEPFLTQYWIWAAVGHAPGLRQLDPDHSARREGDQHPACRSPCFSASSPSHSP